MQTDHAAVYAGQLLRDLNLDTLIDQMSDHPAISWRRSGLLETTGLMLPLPLASHVDGVLLALKSLAPNVNLPASGAVLMGERARLRKTVRQGRFCAGGYGRLLDAKDGRIALNLVREDDWDLIPAWLEDYVTDWDGIIEAVKGKEVNVLTSRAAELGLAIAEDVLPERPTSWLDVKRFERGDLASSPLVVDLSGLWAGPLASSLLQTCGARVIKVEGPQRPDGMRNGHKGFYDLLNAGKDCAAFDFKNADDLACLKQLLHKADIVIEASRPRALRQLGVFAKDFLTARPGKIWARLTAYGQGQNRIGFGDDIGISAGLATIMARAHGQPCFVGDAIADPVNGVHLALAIWAMRLQGGGALIDLSMVDVLRYAMGGILEVDMPDDLPSTAKAWQALADQDGQPLYDLRSFEGRIASLGEHTAKITANL